MDWYESDCQLSIDNHVGRTDFRRLARFYTERQFYGEGSGDTCRWQNAVSLRLSGTDTAGLFDKIAEISSVLVKGAP